MKGTRHNGRSSKGQVYSVKHNDRKFDLDNAEHIDEDRAAVNIYWDCFNQFHTSTLGIDPDGEDSFEAVEKKYYYLEFHDFVDAQNERNAKTRHTERNRTTEDLRMDKRTCPEETIYQIGDKDDHVPPDVLFEIVTDYLERFTELYEGKIQILDLALHVDESTPHIHERHVFETKNQYGEVSPQQEKTLEELGFDLPDPDKKPGRYNNRKMTFDSACRAMFFDVCRDHGLDLDEEPEYGGRKYLEKQDFIRMKQKETIAEQDQMIEQKEEKVDELTMKIEDFESLLDDVSEIAYDKAVEVVSDKVREETVKETVSVVKDLEDQINTSKRFSSEVRKVVNNVLNEACSLISGLGKKIAKAVDNVLKKPEVRSAGIEEVKTGSRESVLAKLKAGQEEVRRRDQENQGKKPDKEKEKNTELR